MTYKNKSIKKYAGDLSARLPAPGGGSASALVGCMGAALINMVLNFTIGKKKYKRYEPGLKKSLRRNRRIMDELINLIDKDVSAYKSGDLSKSLAVPYKICKLASEAIGFCPEAINKTNRNLITDIADAAVFLEASFSGAYYNVLINLKYLPKTAKNNRILRELRLRKGKVSAIRKNTEERIGKLIRR